jgi:hypothetical protein
MPGYGGVGLSAETRHAPTCPGAGGFAMPPELLPILQQFIGTILGGFISGLVGLWVENRRRRNERRERHFQELKERCLKPLRKELRNLCEHFEFEEGKTPVRLMEETLESDIHWWDYYSLKRSARCDEILFEDLPNHFPGLASRLAEVERRVKQDYPEFYREILCLLREIRSCKELKELSSQATFKSDPEIPYNAVFLAALGYDRGYWPNYYDLLKRAGKVDLVYKLGSSFSESKHCKKAKSIKGDIVPLIDSCIREIDEILLRKELRGRCKYV